MRGRGTETEESLSKRLAAAEAELEFSRETGSHDIIIINDAIDRAFDELVAFIDANWDASKNAPLKSSSEVPAPVADHPTSAAEVPASSPEALVPPAADAATAPAKNDTPAPVATLEKTLALIKPDAYGTGKKVAIIDRIKEAGFTIVQEKELTMTAELAKNFYKEHDGKPFFEGLVTRMTR